MSTSDGLAPVTRAELDSIDDELVLFGEAAKALSLWAVAFREVAQRWYESMLVAPADRDQLVTVERRFADELRPLAEASAAVGRDFVTALHAVDAGLHPILLRAVRAGVAAADRSEVLEVLSLLTTVAAAGRGLVGQFDEPWLATPRGDVLPEVQGSLKEIVAELRAAEQVGPLLAEWERLIDVVRAT